MSEDRASKDFQHKHKGKNSEALLDKNKILKALNLIAGQTILDAGCGNGYMSKEFAQLVKPNGTVYALDIDPVVIEKLKSENKDNIIKPMTGDITQPEKIKAGSIDLLYLSTVFHGFSLDQIADFVKHAQRLLKPSAILAIVEMNKVETAFGPPFKIRVSPQELKQLIPLCPKQIIEVNEYFYLQLFENK